MSSLSLLQACMRQKIWNGLHWVCAHKSLQRTYWGLYVMLISSHFTEYDVWSWVCWICVRSFWKNNCSTVILFSNWYWKPFHESIHKQKEVILPASHSCVGADKQSKLLLSKICLEPWSIRPKCSNSKSRKEKTERTQRVFKNLRLTWKGVFLR